MTAATRRTSPSGAMKWMPWGFFAFCSNAFCPLALLDPCALNRVEVSQGPNDPRGSRESSHTLVAETAQSVLVSTADLLGARALCLRLTFSFRFSTRKVALSALSLPFSACLVELGTFVALFGSRYRAPRRTTSTRRITSKEVPLFLTWMKVC